MDTLQRLTQVFRRVFENDDIMLTPQTAVNDIDSWDSMSHMNLILAVEAEFGIEFTQREATRFRNVGELATSIDQKLAQK